MPKNIDSWILSGLSLGLIVGIGYFAYQQFDRTSLNNSFSYPAKSFVLKGKAIKGALLKAKDDRGQNITLKIQDVELDPQDTEKDIYLYTVLYQITTTSQWQNLCQSDRSGVAKAIPLSGKWDNRGNYIDDETITWACTNGALAKCVRWGYKPWKTIDRQSLRNFHQACTRMVRADYCGDGVSHTKNGTPIDVYDRLKIQQQVENTGMSFEAAWNGNGAVAINTTRFPESMVEIKRKCPERLKLLPDKESQLSQLEKYAPDALLFNDSFPNSQF
jgi:hypothetical protein